MFTMTLLQSQGFCPMCGAMAGWGWIGMVLMAVFWIAVIALVVWVVVRLTRRDGER